MEVEKVQENLFVREKNCAKETYKNKRRTFPKVQRQKNKQVVP